MRVDWRFPATYLLLLLLTTGCGGSAENRLVPQPPSTTDTPASDYKISELNFIQTELKARHPNLFFKRSETEFDLDVAQLKNDAPDMTDMEFRLASTKLVATIGDQHTYMIMHEPTLLMFPFEVWWVDDAAIIIKATEQYKDYLGYELVSIDGTPLDNIKDIAMQYLAHENDVWKDALSPRFLKYAELLAFEGVIASPDSANVELLSPQGQTQFIDVNSRYQPEFVEIEAQQQVPPMYSRSDDNYWFRLSNGVLFIQYNSCFDSQGYPLTRFITDLEEILGNEQIEKIAVDLRFNHGGRINHFVPVIEVLATSQFNSPDTLFVITGRNTFSAGVGTVYSFYDLTEASFIGGPTGGKPNGFSHVLGFTFSGSLNSLYMATDYLEVTDEDTDTFMPEVLTPFTQNDFLQGTDPALEYILAH